ncbi:hypothetical protein C475_04855 [Halosimplex carlsbadense 2-9-1]|uniref:Uncharacterized protein n=1 Tax=Halosimplex carlsbadense 2-9-1 TaxID=797114 RepID=M0CY02_9EURY|nr:hypothetical protein C475_04855 [Halosimplex carlsbadense 2-9-1]
MELCKCSSNSSADCTPSIVDLRIVEAVEVKIIQIDLLSIYIKHSKLSCGRGLLTRTSYSGHVEVFSESPFIKDLFVAIGIVFCKRDIVHGVFFIRSDSPFISFLGIFVLFRFIPVVSGQSISESLKRLFIVFLIDLAIDSITGINPKTLNFCNYFV